MAVWSLEPDQQDELLDRAEAEGLPCAKLREIVRSINCIESDDEELVTDDDAGVDEFPGEPSGDPESWSEICVKAFRKAENRMEAMRLITSELEPHEAAVVRDWIVERLH